MKLRSILMAGVVTAAAFGIAPAATAADNKQIQMLHWWTSGGEAAALNVIKEALGRRAMAGRTSRSPAAAAVRR